MIKCLVINAATQSVEGYIMYIPTTMAVRISVAELETSQHHAAPQIPSRWKQRPDGGKLQWISPQKKVWFN
jgi:hypothetical protein